MQHIIASNLNGKSKNILDILFFVLRIFLFGMKFLIIVSRTKNALTNFYFRNVLFLILDFYFRNKKYSWNFKIMLDVG